MEKKPIEIHGNISYSLKVEGDGRISFKLNATDNKNAHEHYFVAISMVAKEILQILASPVGDIMPERHKQELNNTIDVLKDLLSAKGRRIENEQGMSDPQQEEMLQTILELFKDKLNIDSVEGLSVQAFELGGNGMEKMNLADLIKKIKGEDHSDENTETPSKKEDSKDNDGEIFI